MPVAGALSTAKAGRGECTHGVTSFHSRKSARAWEMHGGGRIAGAIPRPPPDGGPFQGGKGGAGSSSRREFEGILVCALLSPPQ